MKQLILNGKNNWNKVFAEPNNNKKKGQALPKAMAH